MTFLTKDDAKTFLRVKDSYTEEAINNIAVNDVTDEQVRRLLNLKYLRTDNKYAIKNIANKVAHLVEKYAYKSTNLHITNDKVSLSINIPGCGEISVTSNLQE